MRSLFVVGPVLSWHDRYVQNYVFAFCACGWCQVLFRNLLAEKVCLCDFVFPENKPVDIALTLSTGSFYGNIETSTGFRQNIGTPTGRLGNFFGLFPYYDIYLQVLKLDGLAVIFPTTKPYLGV
jgi:hypothetical protein